MKFLRFPVEDFEVVGMHGDIHGLACSRSVPVVRHRTSNMYALYSESQTTAYSESEIHKFALMGRLTLFPPMELVETATVVYISEEMLKELGLAHPPSQVGSEPMKWQEIEWSNGFVSVMDKDSSTNLMNQWAVILTRRALSFIQRFFYEGHLDFMIDAYRLLEFAHSAAGSTELRLFITAAKAVCMKWIPGKSSRNIVASIPEIFTDVSESEFLLMVERLELLCREHPDRTSYPEILLWRNFAENADAYQEEMGSHQAIHGQWMKEEMAKRDWLWIIVSGFHVLTGSADFTDMPFADEVSTQAASDGLMLFVSQKT